MHDEQKTWRVHAAPTNNGIAAHEAARPHLSQSECNDWAACPARAWARWFEGYRPPDQEDRPRRVGTMGHAVLRDRVEARFVIGRVPDARAACETEARQRGWGDVLEEEFEAADAAAYLVAEHLNLDGTHVVPNLYAGDADSRGGPMAEVRLRAPWIDLGRLYADGGDAAERLWHDVRSCSAVRTRFAGIEGQPDLVHMPDGPGGPWVVPDYKFRQRPDLGGAQDEADSPVPDRQGAWYLALLHAVGMRPAGGLWFEQVNVYAGRWLAVDDFVRAASGHVQTDDEARLVTDSGLPSRDLDGRIGKVGMVTADVWAEAHRALANERHAAKLAAWNGKGKRPERTTAAEDAGARQFVETLRAYRPVVSRRHRADPIVCREVVRDMVVGVDGPLAVALRGQVPARNLQSHRTAACVRPHGCPIQTSCLASLGTHSLRSLLRDHAEQGALVHPRQGSTAAELRR